MKAELKSQNNGCLPIEHPNSEILANSHHKVSGKSRKEQSLALIHKRESKCTKTDAKRVKQKHEYCSTCK